MYFVEIYFSQHGHHDGSIHRTKYDAAARVIGYIADDEDFPFGEDDILKCSDKTTHHFRRSDGKTICHGNINGIDFRILELNYSDIISFL